MRRTLLVIFASLVVATAALGAEPEYTITDLGTLGGSESSAFDVNNHGQVAGHAATAIFPFRAFLWLPAPDHGLEAGMHDLGALPGADTSAGRGINDFAEVVGFSPGEWQGQAFLWLPEARPEFGMSAGMHGLGALPGDDLSAASAVNNSTEIVGYSREVGLTPAHAWICLLLPNYGLGAGMHALGALPTHNQSVARDINDSGFVAGESSIVGVIYKGFMWRSDNREMYPLPSLGGPDVSCAAWGINNANQVVGDSDTDAQASERHALLWENGQITDLGTLGGPDAYALEINDSMEVVGLSAKTGYDNYRAFLWRDNVMHDLNDLIAPESGWFLERANSISNDGKIVGEGWMDGEWHAFLLTPVPPLPTLVSTVPVGSTPGSPEPGESLWRCQKNFLRFTFSGDIGTPEAGELEIQQMLAGGAFGPDLSGAFTFTVENDATGHPRILRIDENAATLEHRKWYAFRNEGDWSGVAPFEVQYVVQAGDADNDGRVLFGDLSCINSGVPTDPADDDDRKDINGDRRVLFSDVSAANAQIPSDTVPKPSGH